MAGPGLSISPFPRSDFLGELTALTRALLVLFSLLECPPVQILSLMKHAFIHSFILQTLTWLLLHTFTGLWIEPQPKQPLQVKGCADGRLEFSFPESLGTQATFHPLGGQCFQPAAWQVPESLGGSDQGFSTIVSHAEPNPVPGHLVTL